MIVQLDTETADTNLTSLVTVLTHTPDAVNPMICQGHVLLGVVKPLANTGGDFEVTVSVGGVVVQPNPRVVVVSTGSTSAVILIPPFTVPANNVVLFRVKSPNGADVDVGVTAYLYDLSASAANVTMWNGTAVATPATAGVPSVDAIAISGDTTAADNAESDYDGTGYAGGTIVKAADLTKVKGTALPAESVGGRDAAALGKFLDVATPVGTVNEMPAAVTKWNGAAVGDVYHADIHFARDQGGTPHDEFTVRWFKNQTMLASGITTPTIQVIKRADGTDLVAATAMTQIGSTGAYKYDEATNRVTLGEAVLVVVTATIDAATRTWGCVVGRDQT